MAAVLREREWGERGGSHPRSRQSPWESAECGYLASHRQGSRASHGEGRPIQGGNMLHGECGPSWRASAAPGYGAVGVYRGGSFHRLMTGRSIPAILWKGLEFPGTGSAPPC